MFAFLLPFYYPAVFIDLNQTVLLDKLS